MSQKLILAILGAVIITGGGAWYYQTNLAAIEDLAKVKSSSGELTKEKSAGVLDAIKSEVTDSAGSLAAILSGGEAQKCTFSGTDPSTKEYTAGTVYIAGESFKMEADTTIEGQKGTINMIQKDSVMYMWSDNAEMMPGIKIDVSKFADMEGVKGMEKPESPIDWLKDPESAVEYDCDAWSPRSDSFVPPTDIEFTDMFAGMGAMFGEIVQ